MANVAAVSFFALVVTAGVGAWQTRPVCQSGGRYTGGQAGHGHHRAAGQVGRGKLRQTFT